MGVCTGDSNLLETQPTGVRHERMCIRFLKTNRAPPI